MDLYILPLVFWFRSGPIILFMMRFRVGYLRTQELGTLYYKWKNTIRSSVVAGRGAGVPRRGKHLYLPMELER